LLNNQPALTGAAPVGSRQRAIESAVRGPLFYVLVVDDNDSDLLLFKHVAETVAPAWRVQTIEGGHMALDCVHGTGIFANHPIQPLPRLVFLDLKMPAVDGFEVLRCIRNHPRWQTIVVIIFTSSDDPGEIQRAYELGANSFLRKPCSYDELSHLIRVVDQFWRCTTLLSEPDADKAILKVL
jgi:CheY-like chemotaxis protein